MLTRIFSYDSANDLLLQSWARTLKTRLPRSEHDSPVRTFPSSPCFSREGLDAPCQISSTFPSIPLIAKLSPFLGPPPLSNPTLPL